MMKYNSFLVFFAIFERIDNIVSYVIYVQMYV